jgi:hypothetical protein
VFAAHYFIARASLDTERLRKAILSNHQTDISEHRKKAVKSIRNAIKNSKKAVLIRPEVSRSTGIYYWLIGKQTKAVKWWKRAIDENTKLGARPNLARIYMEIGRRFLEEKSMHKKLNGISAEEYLEKARSMFHEMDLQWDLDELDKIVSS